MSLDHKITLPNGSLVGVWKITESEEELLTRYTPSLEEQETLDSFHSSQRRTQWLSVRIMLAEILEERHSVLYTPSGKPFIDSISSEISISHSHDYSSVMVCPTGKAGLDIQLISNKVIRIKHKFLHANEVKWMNGAAEDELLLTVIWSVKEAVYKYFSDPKLFFNTHINILEFELNTQGDINAVIEYNGQAYEMLLGYYAFEGYVLVFILE